MNVKRIYIAGGITGITEEVYKANFAKAKETVEQLGYKPVSPLDIRHEANPDFDGTWESYMKGDLKVLLDCYGVFAMRNWEESKGASIEVNLAKKLKMHLIYQEQ